MSQRHLHSGLWTWGGGKERILIGLIADHYTVSLDVRDYLGNAAVVQLDPATAVAIGEHLVKLGERGGAAQVASSAAYEATLAGTDETFNDLVAAADAATQVGETAVAEMMP